jgi:hypothetical protein
MEMFEPKRHIIKVKQSHNTHREVQGGRECIAPTHSRPRH